MRLVINSGAANETSHVQPLEDAGYAVPQSGERAMVTALEQRFSDFDPTGLRLPGLGVPGYLANVAGRLGKPFGEEGRHGYASFRNEVNSRLLDAAAYNVLLTGLTVAQPRGAWGVISRTLDQMQASRACSVGRRVEREGRAR
jgi:hypothetical protein